MKKPSPLFIIIFSLIVIGATIRVLRHFGILDLPPNVAPVSALAYLAAAYLPRRWGWFVPGGLMVASDMAIGGYEFQVMLVVYASFGISYLLGWWLRRSKAWWRLGLVSVVGSVIFFLLTNAAVWAWGRIYPLTGAGLFGSYLAGLPFFRYTLLGDLAFTGLFFGLAAALLWARRFWLAPRPAVHQP